MDEKRRRIFVSLWIQLFRTEFEKALTYRTDFLMRVLGKALSVSLISWYLWSSIFSSENRSSIGGLNLDEMGIYYLVLPLTLMLVMNQDFDSLSTDIYDGSLSKYLVYPRSYVLMSFVRKLSASWISLLPYLFIWLGFKLFAPDTSISQIPGNAILFFLAWSLFAFPFYFLSASVFDLLAFWFEQTWSLRSILRFTTLFLGGGYVPLSLFPESWMKWLHFLPFQAAIGFQTLSVARGEVPPLQELIQNFANLMIWTLFSAVAVWSLWRRGLKSFNGSGM